MYVICAKVRFPFWGCCPVVCSTIYPRGRHDRVFHSGSVVSTIYTTTQLSPPHASCVNVRRLLDPEVKPGASTVPKITPYTDQRLTSSTICPVIPPTLPLSPRALLEVLDDRSDNLVGLEGREGVDRKRKGVFS